MNIKSSIIILFRLATDIKWISETNIVSAANKATLNQVRYFDPHFNKQPFQDSISEIFGQQLIILSCSFLDEFERVFNPKEFPFETEKIQTLKQIVRPAIKRIKEWVDLKNYRNHILAHNLRVKGQSVFEFELKPEYKVPTTIEEFALLADMIFIIAQNIQPCFPEAVRTIDFSISIDNSIRKISKESNCIEEFRHISSKVETNRTKLLS